MRSHWIRIGMLVMVLLISASCSKETKEEKHMEEEVKQSQLLVSELTKARLDNRDVQSVYEVFQKYKGKIAEDIWEEWFDIENPVVEDSLQIVDKYGYVPIDSEIEKVNYGKNKEEGYFFTVVATIQAQQEGSELVNKEESVYLLYEFNNEGVVVDFMFFSQDKENVQ